jgi:DsbC/DsbD-like thiol-disulfide interchange protein/cytochrome c biogenesis protein CcdA/thiol-disulfide isomerase/thioredoxin
MKRLLAAIVGIGLWVSGPAAAQIAGSQRYAEVSLIAEREVVSPGETIYVALDMQMVPGWHVYWRNPGDAGLPPKFLPDGASTLSEADFGEFLWPLPRLLPVEPGRIMDYGYDGRLVLPMPVTIPADAAGRVRISGEADYLICESVCVPETADVFLELEVGAPRENPRSGGLIAEWIGKVPVPFPGEARIDRSGVAWTLSVSQPGGFPDGTSLRFFPFHHDIAHPPDQPQRAGPDGASLSLTPGRLSGAGGNLDGVIRVDAPGAAPRGYEISASPGPVLPGTADRAAAILAPASGPGGLGAIVLLAGAALLGGLILNLMPCVLPVLSMKAIGMVTAAASGQASVVRAHGLWYTAGVVVSFAALAAILLLVRAATGFATLGFQLQHPPTVAVLALVMFAVGLWLMGFFELGHSIQNTGSGLAGRGGSGGAFFTGVLAAVVGAPCVGPFLGAALGAVMSQPAVVVIAVFLAMGFGMALPFLLLSFMPGLHRALPKPGRWMETLKQAFSFPMFLTAAWLLAVLAGLAGAEAVGWTVAGATTLVFAIWIAREGGLVRRGVAVAALGAAFALPAVQANVPAGSAVRTAELAGDYAEGAWSPEKVAELIAQGRPVFVDFTASWCASCQVNKMTTLRTKRVQDAFERADVAFLVADFTQRDPVIADELRRRGRAGVPMYLWFAPGETEPQILPEILTQDMVLRLVEGL